MRLVLKLFLCLCVLPAGVFCQEKIKQIRVGPYGDQVRIVVAFVEPSEETFKMQSLIIDVEPVKNKNQQPSSYLVDLTSTVRTLSTGAKNQKILVLRWNKAGEIETKCDGKWTKQNNAADFKQVIEVVKSVVQSVPLDAKSPTEATLPPEVEQKVTSILAALDTQNFPCLRNVK